jgi:hypothetical protein
VNFTGGVVFMDTLEHLVSIYNRNMAGYEEWKLSDFRNKSKPLEELIKDAVYGLLPTCKQDSHQSQISRDVIKEMQKKLLDPAVIEEIKNCKRFIEIFNLVFCLKIPGFSSLCVYDTALRIGAIFGLYPDGCIFLHAGALEGARNLLGRTKLETLTQYYENDTKYPYIPKACLPKELQILDAHHLENFFCRLKERLLQKS